MCLSSNSFDTFIPKARLLALLGDRYADALVCGEERGADVAFVRSSECFQQVVQPVFRIVEHAPDPNRKAVKQVKRQPAPPKVKGIGDHLKDIIRDRWGAVPCEACREDVAALNSMTAEQALAEAPALAARMAERWEQLPRWWMRLGAKLAASNPLTRPLVERHIIAAIGEAVGRAVTPPG